MIAVTAYAFGNFTANTYLCKDAASGSKLVIDPGTDARAAVETLAPLKPALILLTHGHFDHITAAEPLRAATGAKIAIHRADAALLSDPDLNASRVFSRGDGVRMEADFLLSDHDTVPLGESAFLVLHTPGHTPGSCCFLCDGKLFSGDTLFCDGFGRCDLPGGDENRMRQSLQALLSLPKETVLYPGHEETSTLAREETGIRRYCGIDA